MTEEITKKDAWEIKQDQRDAMEIERHRLEVERHAKLMIELDSSIDYRRRCEERDQKWQAYDREWKEGMEARSKEHLELAGREILAMEDIAESLRSLVTK